VVPHIIIQSLHLRVREFESHLAKRLLQQYLPTAEVDGLIRSLRTRTGRAVWAA
jgi:hypothetical protein